MRQAKFLKDVSSDSRKVLNRFMGGDFSGNVGQAIKNSSWQLSTNVIAKIGSLMFTIILARLLTPEVYGLYGLALSTILFLGVFSDLGLVSALITFISKTIDKNSKKAKGYLYYITKLKLFLLSFASLILIVSARWIADSYYNKPIFYAILAGALYLPIVHSGNWLSSLLIAKNNFRITFFKELILQITRLTIVPLSIIYLMKRVLVVDVFLFFVFIIISICYFMTTIFLLIRLKQTKSITKQKAEVLNSEEKKEMYKFVIPLSITALSGAFFGYIDIIMLGRYVESAFIAYYQVAFNLIVSASAILGFMGIALLPIFSRIKNKESIKLFRKSRLILFLISILAVIFTLLVSRYLVLFVYGADYLPAVFYLRIFSLLLISFPMIELYVSYYTSQRRTVLIAISLLLSTVLNIVLNYIFINIGLKYGMDKAVLGACFATIISRYVYLGILGIARKIKR